MRKCHRWTESEKEILRLYYKGSNQSTLELARRLSILTGENITFYAVKGQAHALGLAKTYGRPWTPEEERKLLRMLPHYHPSGIAKALHRSDNSVVTKIKRMNLSRRLRDGWFTQLEASNILGVTHRFIENCISDGKLKATWHNPEETIRHIDLRDLRDFIRQYPMELTGRNLNFPIVVDILCGLDYNHAREE